MKAVLMSIKPLFGFKIAKKDKIWEIRKNKPTLSPPFKVFIYCTCGRKRQLHISNSYSTTKSPYEQFWVGKPINDICKGRYLGNGKVIGEFVCDRIEEWDSEYWNDNSVYQAISRIDYDDEGDYEWVNISSNEDDNPSDNYLCKESCLSFEDIQRYAGNGRFYAWHITDLVIYDKPMELSEFRILNKEKQKACAHRERYYTNPDWTNSAELPAGFTCDIGTEIDFCRPYKNKSCTCLKPITRPPQSWCYVEVSNEV